MLTKHEAHSRAQLTQPCRSNTEGQEVATFARVLPAGDLDSSFGDEGKTIVASEGGIAASGVVMRPDGRLVASCTSDTTDIAVVQLTPSGMPDPLFGVQGVSVVSLPGDQYGSDVAVQADGRVLVSGTESFSAVEYTFALARFGANGTLDASFGEGGIATADFGDSGFDQSTAPALQPDGKAVVVGQALSSWIGMARFVVGAASGHDSLGVFAPDSATWFVRNSTTPGPADVFVIYGAGGAGLAPAAGDWDGDGDDTPGLYDPASGTFFLKNSFEPGPADATFQYGPPMAGWLPLVGDWDGDGVDTVGLYAPTSGFFFLRNELAPGPADLTYSFGTGANGWIAISGDWNGDGVDTVGLYVPESGFFFLRDQHAPGAADLSFAFGPPDVGWTPITGDFDGDGCDTVGLYNPAESVFFLRNRHEPGAADLVVGYGSPGLTPLVGDWDGQ